jgi:pimeloyl-ACP methyl ester carboxylesterase
MNPLELPSKLLFLPGASGNTRFWKPVADILEYPGEQIFLGWPSFGPTPLDPEVNGIDDLVAMTEQKIDRPSVLIAQSMGGVIAIKAALQKPGLVTGLVLTATSGGVNFHGIEIEDWRKSFQDENPSFPAWFSDYSEDLSPSLGNVKIPALLLWGDSDPVSPLAVGQRLNSHLPHARLHVIHGGNHDLAMTHAKIVGPLIDEFLINSINDRSIDFLKGHLR